MNCLQGIYSPNTGILEPNVATLESFKMISPEYEGEIKSQFFNQLITNYVCKTEDNINNTASQHLVVHDTSMPVRGLIINFMNSIH